MGTVPASARELELIAPRFFPRVWGSRDLRAWYPGRALEAEPIGEAWLSPADSPVLVKMLFPQEKLSVQVHPDDAYAAAHGLGRGKSEAWYVVEAAPDARLGVGLRRDARWEELESACRAGRGAEMLDWIAVAPGEVINIPAGTVHAIGGGVVLFEVQQPSDTTFRLDDYGRGRELHLGPGLEVARATSAGKVAHGLGPRDSGLLLATEHFRLWRHVLVPGGRIAPAGELRWLVCLDGQAAIPRGQLAALQPGAAFVTPNPCILMEICAGMP